MTDRKDRELRMIRQQLQRRNKKQVAECGNGLIKAILIMFVVVIIAIAIGLAILVF